MLIKVKCLKLRYWLGRCSLVQFLCKTKIWSDKKKHLPSQYFNSRNLTFRSGCYNFPIPSTMDPKCLWSCKCILIICDFIMNLAQLCLWTELGSKVTNLQLISFFVSETLFLFLGWEKCSKSRGYGLRLLLGDGLL